MQRETITIVNKRGLHARAATKLATEAGRFGCQITIAFAGKEVDCKSVMSILLLAATVNSDVTLTTSGEDELDAMAQLKHLITNKFEERD